MSSNNPRTAFSEVAEDIRRRSITQWGAQKATNLVGLHESLQVALQRAVRFAPSESPVLITGETGTGKELFARALFLMSNRVNKPMLCVNCAQYISDQLLASELFGHVRGSFTGAVSDHPGVFQAADGGVVFLDEIGDLAMPAQAMLLRTLSEGEIVPVGSTRPRKVNVRVFAATSRDLQRLMHEGRFRSDLYYRLRQLRIHVPPLRERGDDWQVIAQHFLDDLAQQTSTRKVFAKDTVARLRLHGWPGNVREVRSCVETGFHASESAEITPSDLCEALEQEAREHQFGRIPFEASEFYARMSNGEENFWKAVHDPYMDRELNREQVRMIVDDGLMRAGGSYKRLFEIFGVDEGEYLKLMDFLRHHRLKPEHRKRAWTSRTNGSESVQPTVAATAAGRDEPIPFPPQ